MNRVVVSSVANFVALLQQYPALLSLSSFSSLQPILLGLQVNNGSGCGKPACNKQLLKDNRNVFEGAMTALQGEEKERMKNILGVKEVCYYTMRNGQLDLACF